MVQEERHPICLLFHLPDFAPAAALHPHADRLVPTWRLHPSQTPRLRRPQQPKEQLPLRAGAGAISDDAGAPLTHAVAITEFATWLRPRKHGLDHLLRHRVPSTSHDVRPTHEVQRGGAWKAARRGRTLANKASPLSCGPALQRSALLPSCPRAPTLPRRGKPPGRVNRVRRRIRLTGPVAVSGRQMPWENKWLGGEEEHRWPGACGTHRIE